MGTYIVMPSEKVIEACEKAIIAYEDRYEEDEAKAIDEFADEYENRWFRRLRYALTGKKTELSFEEAKALYNKSNYYIGDDNKWYWRQMESSRYQVHSDWYKRLRSMSRFAKEMHLDQDSFKRLEPYL